MDSDQCTLAKELNLNWIKNMHEIERLTYTYQVLLGSLYIVVLAGLAIVLYQGFVYPGYIVKGDKSYVVDCSKPSSSIYERRERRITKWKYIGLVTFFSIIFLIMTGQVIELIVSRSNNELAAIEKSIIDMEDLMKTYSAPETELISRSARSVASEYTTIKLDKYFPKQYKDHVLTATHLVHVSPAAAKPIAKYPINEEFLVRLKVTAQSLEFAKLIEKHPLFSNSLQ
ncbi:hypothetical protein NEAUS03_1440 [Nematocida ausubeli]|nr:hypothetical protein NEAUS03_1440 [Nematocida ausubeli]